MQTEVKGDRVLAKSVLKALLFLLGGLIALWIHVPRATTAWQMQFGELSSTKAVLTKWTSQDNGPYLASYEFTVEGKRYNGRCFFDSDLCVGDEATVEYVTSNPRANCLAAGYKMTVFPLLFGIVLLGVGAFQLFALFRRA
jgi:hypothetical protein